MLSVQNIVYWSPFWEGLGRERVEGALLQESNKAQMLSQPLPTTSFHQPV